MSEMQLPPDPLDISLWESDANYGGVFPKGARDKSLYHSPSDVGENLFLKSSFNYLFKESSHRYPEQFWAEIIAYRIGCHVGVKVPPTFVAYRKDSASVTCGALIEWFYDVNSPNFFSYYDGGDLLCLIIEEFDHLRGTKHNLKDVFALFKLIERLDGIVIDERWVDDFIKIILFDALIGNIDRHQNNWGIITNINDEKRREVSLSPAFDNGTSLGHEILEKNFVSFGSEAVLNRYINRGKHHIRFDINSEKLGHFEALEIIFSKLPHSVLLAHYLLNFNFRQLENDILNLTKFNPPVPLTRKRVEFVLMLLRERVVRINILIDKYTR